MTTKTPNKTLLWIEGLQEEIRLLREDLQTMNWEQRRHTLERCIRLIEDEPEAPGPMPPEFFMVPMEDAFRAAIRATKKSLVAKIRKLIKEGINKEGKKGRK